MVPAKRIERLDERDEVTRDKPGPLMDQLIKRVLSVGSRLAPVDGPGRVVNLGPLKRHVFAVALHRQLLQVSGESLEILLVWQNRDGLCAEEVIVPYREKTHEHGQVALEWRGPEVLIHFVKAAEQAAEVFRADRQHRREADRRIH